jgi:hypothetical protein
MSFRTRNEEKSYKICKADIANRIRFLSIVRNDIFFLLKYSTINDLHTIHFQPAGNTHAGFIGQ